MKTFSEFLNEYALTEAHKDHKLPDGWIMQVQPHFEEQYEKRNGNVDLDKFFQMIYDTVSKWKDDPNKNWDKNEIGFIHTKTNTRAIFNVNVPKKIIRTITYLNPEMVVKVGTKTVRLREGEYLFEEYEATDEDTNVFDVAEIVLLEDAE